MTSRPAFLSAAMAMALAGSLVLASVGAAQADPPPIGEPTVGESAAATAESTPSNSLPVLESSQPAISGYPAVGTEFTVDTGTWTPGTVFSYQWMTDKGEISGATDPTYIATTGNIYRTLRIALTGSKPGFSPVTQTSRPTPTIYGIQSGPVPTVTGNALAGQTLTVHMGDWPAGTQFNYYWGTASGSGLLANAYQDQYTIHYGHIGQQIRAVVHVNRPGYYPTVATSEPTDVVAPATTPTITGKAMVGEILTVNNVQWWYNTTFKYQWFADGSAIPGATAPTFALLPAQAGKKITASITGTPLAGQVVTLASDETESVAAAPGVIAGTRSIPTSGDLVAVDPAGLLWNYGNLPGTARKLIGSGWGSASSLFTEDWNRDGTQDIVVAWKNGDLGLYLGSPTGGFQAARKIGFGWGGYQFMVGQWSRADRYPSIVAKDSAGRLWNYNNLTGTAINNRVQIGSGWSGLDILLLDFDKDGANDIVARTQAGTLLSYRGAGTGGFRSESRPVIGQGWGAMTTMPTKQFNAREGILSRDPSGTLWLYPTGKSSFEPRQSLGSGWNGFLVAG